MLPDLHLLLLVITQQDVELQLPGVKLLHDVSSDVPDLVLQNALLGLNTNAFAGISSPSFEFNPK